MAFANNKVSFALIHPRQKPLGHLQVMLLLQSREKKRKESKSECKTRILYGTVFYLWRTIVSRDILSHDSCIQMFMPPKFLMEHKEQIREQMITVFALLILLRGEKEKKSGNRVRTRHIPPFGVHPSLLSVATGI